MMGEDVSVMTSGGAFERVEGLTAFELANMAGVACPDTVESPGARFLTGVRGAVVEAVRWTLGEYAVTVVEAAEMVRDGDDLVDVADGAPSVYTHELWAQFVDLAAWQVDASGMGAVRGDDLSMGARIALYEIAYRLGGVILDQLIEDANDNDGEGGL